MFQQKPTLPTAMRRRFLALECSIGVRAGCPRQSDGPSGRHTRQSIAPLSQLCTHNMRALVRLENQKKLHLQTQKSAIFRFTVDDLSSGVFPRRNTMLIKISAIQMHTISIDDILKI